MSLLYEVVAYCGGSRHAAGPLPLDAATAKAAEYVRWFAQYDKPIAVHVIPTT